MRSGLKPALPRAAERSAAVRRRDRLFFGIAIIGLRVDRGDASAA
jgi:hypothetical protein